MNIPKGALHNKPIRAPLIQAPLVYRHGKVATCTLHWNASATAIIPRNDTTHNFSTLRSNTHVRLERYDVLSFVALYISFDAWSALERRLAAVEPDWEKWREKTGWMNDRKRI